MNNNSYRFVLCPVQTEKGSQYLQEVILYDRKEIIIGRNSLKFIDGGVDEDAVYLSRNHLKLEARDDKVFIIPVAQARRVVAVNGQGRDNSVRFILFYYFRLFYLSRLSN